MGSKVADTSTLRFVFLDFFRFIFAIFVALMHYSQGQYPIKAYLAVDFFFVLSGFVLTHAYQNRANQNGFMANFIVDRIARLYPLFLLTLFILIFMNGYFHYKTGAYLEQGWAYKDGYLYTFILNIFLLQNVGLTTSSSWNVPGWSISVEFIASCILAFFLQWHILNGKKAFWVALIVILGCYVLLFNYIHFLGDFSTNLFGSLNSGLIRGCAGILLGFVAYHTFMNLSNRLVNSSMNVLILTVAGIALMLCIFFGDSVKNADFAAVPIIFLFVLSLAIFEVSIVDSVPRWLISTMETAGALSYAVYLLHWPMLTFCRYVLVYAHRIKIDFNSLPFGFGFFGLLIMFSAMIHFRFELQMKLLIKTFKQKRL